MDRDPAPARTAEGIADLALVQAALRGDDLARQRLVQRLVELPALLRARHRRMGTPLTPDLFEDVVQNVLLALWEKLAAFDGRVPLPAWAFGFGTYELLKAVQRHARERGRQTDLSDVVDHRTTRNLDTDDHLLTILQQLEPQDLDILQHKHIDGRTFAEIGALLGWPPASVKSRYYRALTAMRRRLPGATGEKEEE
jgi:RNA polymerase sigma-70 factor (ECF subfamily)